MELTQKTAEKGVCGRADETDAQLSFLSPGCALHPASQMVDALKQHPCFVEYNPAGRRERNAVPAAREQFGADSCLEVFHRAAERRLRHSQAPRSFGKAQFLSDRLEISEMTQFHGRHAAPASR